ALTTTIAWLFMIVWLVVLVYYWLAYKNNKSLWLNGLPIIVLVIITIFSILLILLTQSDTYTTGSGAGTNNNKAALTSEQCQPYKEKYDNKVLKVSSDGLQGTIGIKIDDTNGCKLKAYYNVVLARNLPYNPYKRDIVPTYNYIVTLKKPTKTSRDRYDSAGALSAAYKNQTVLIDPYASSRERADFYSQGVTPTETRYFYWGYEIDTNFSESRYKEIFAETQFGIVDGQKYIEEEQSGDGSASWSINHDKAATEGTIVKSYNLTIKE
ncbi:MAG TPA: hypothetical protein PKB15_04310, partial [Acidimicrobiia bacterium]|nr:hypothetical protein [Acidimicrobiia bacterium]